MKVEAYLTAEQRERMLTEEKGETSVPVTIHDSEGQQPIEIENDLGLDAKASLVAIGHCCERPRDVEWLAILCPGSEILPEAGQFLLEYPIYPV